MSSGKPGLRLSELPTFTSISPLRLKSLYSDFSPQKASNPASFNTNLDWWRKTLVTLVGQGLQENSQDVLILNSSQALAEQLRYPGVGRPLALAAVIIELERTRSIIPLNDFLNASTSIYYAGSFAYRAASYVVAKPLWWALEQLSLVESEDHFEPEFRLWRKAKGPYVVMSNVEQAADAAVNLLRKKANLSPADSLYSFDSFRKDFGRHSALIDGVALSELDIKVLIKFLDRDRGVLVTNNEVIKFDESSSHAHRVITAVDNGILELKTGVENMELQIHEIQRRIKEKTHNINNCLREKHKEIALLHLKAKKQLDELLKQRLSSLEILQSTLMQVEAAAQNVEIMKQYESSTATLRSVLSHPSLQREKIEQTMDAMAEATADAREIDEAIRLGADIDGVEFIDEQELESELAGLIEEVQKEQQREEIGVTQKEQGWRIPLPSAPSGPLADGVGSHVETNTSFASPIPADDRQKPLALQRPQEATLSTS